ncbi:MAG: RIP metalloprotease RseP [Chlorobi bacterium]|nr:RIP metalloprotease RseP [Chlorobiota bacterium]
MSDGLIMAIQIIMALSLLVFIHELGHFLFARLFGVRVERFFLFFDAFGIALWEKKIGDTVYGIGWLPLGGYVKIAGMIDESLDTSSQQHEPKPWEFRSKPAWQRLLIILGGIIFNIIFGFLIYGFYLLKYEKTYIPLEALRQDGLYVYESGEKLGFQHRDLVTAINGKEAHRLKDILGIRVNFAEEFTVLRNGNTFLLEIPDSILMMDYIRKHGFPYRPYKVALKIDSVLPNMPADRAGIQKGDTLWKINNKPIFEIDVLPKFLEQFKNDTITVVVRRQGKEISIPVFIDTSGKMGILIEPILLYPRKEYSVGQAFKFAFSESMEFIYYNAIGLGYIITGKVSAKESIHSPIALARLYGSEINWGRFWRLTALISLILAFVNFLPIPALDGGYALLLLIEMLTGYRPSPKFMEYFVRVGLILLLLLMGYAFIKDIIVLILGG